MISARQLLPLLVGAAFGTGGWMYGSRGAGTSTSGNGATADDRLRIASEEIELLQRENESLRSLAQGGGEFAVPQEMIDQVQEDYGLEFLASPVVHMVAGEELGYRIEAAIESRMGPQGIDDRQEAFQRIGWLDPGDKLLEQLVAIKSVGAKGWFDEESGDAWVTDDFDLKNIPDQAVLLRLLVRVLLDQHFPDSSVYPGDDAARAKEALHAGAASGAESRFYAANARAIGFLPSNENSAAARLLLVLSEFIQGLTMFPAMEGKNLADTLYVKGVEEFSDGMRNLPESTFGVVFPNAEKRGGKVDFPEIEDEIYLEESAGYLGIRLWISELGDVGIAEQVARDWSKDGYALFADGEVSTGLMWKVEFQTAGSADIFQEAALQRAGAMAGLESAAELGVLIEATDGRFFRVERISETSVKFVNAAKRDTAEL
ncbi:hypothetical protein [Luteolibacter sp. AS25]|uniref:hypothetical protein n=1 Tax=Luteolibacter sp. AS25 TaxID=3135776 RepID=UPI00398AAE20